MMDNVDIIRRSLHGIKLKRKKKDTTELKIVRIFF